MVGAMARAEYLTACLDHTPIEARRLPELPTDEMMETFNDFLVDVSLRGKRYEG